VVEPVSEGGKVGLSIFSVLQRLECTGQHIFEELDLVAGHRGSP
jgi:hypothetical protein